MENKQFIANLESEGYFNIKSIPGKGYCGLFRYIFTVGLVIGIEESVYYGRYCYSNLADAKSALNEWDGTGDPSGDWIKYKGTGGERSRVADQFEN